MYNYNLALVTHLHQRWHQFQHFTANMVEYDWCDIPS